MTLASARGHSKRTPTTHPVPRRDKLLTRTLEYHVHVSTYSLKTRKTTNYRINCDACDDFDGHCTHAEPAGGKIILVNFMYHKIMVVDMEAFPGAPSENEE